MAFEAAQPQKPIKRPLSLFPPLGEKEARGMRGYSPLKLGESGGIYQKGVVDSEAVHNPPRKLSPLPGRGAVLGEGASARQYPESDLTEH